jgi:hypothetical protein
MRIFVDVDLVVRVTRRLDFEMRFIWFCVSTDWFQIDLGDEIELDFLSVVFEAKNWPLSWVGRFYTVISEIELINLLLFLFGRVVVDFSKEVYSLSLNSLFEH